MVMMKFFLLKMGKGFEENKQKKTQNSNKTFKVAFFACPFIDVYRAS